METILLSYVIGFAMAWIFGAAPQDFPQTSMTAENDAEIAQLKLEIQDDPEDVASRVRLGQIYFFHNHLEAADRQFTEASAMAPQEGIVLAWWGTNQTKRAGAALPWCWGICKIVSLKKGLVALDEAVALAPDDPIVRLIRINTLTALQGRFSDFDLVFEDERYFNSQTPEKLDSLPDELMAEVYLALAAAYTWKFKEGGKHPHSPYLTLALSYLEQAEQKNTAVRKESELIRQSLSIRSAL